MYYNESKFQHTTIIDEFGGENYIYSDEVMKSPGVFYIQNTVNEYHSRISGYFETFEDALNNLKYCSDWYRPNGTGRIFKQEFGLSGDCFLLYEKF